MYKKGMRLSGMLLLMCFMVACNSSTKPQVENNESVKVVGNDKDDHGCIGSAGYQWSELLQDCIRPFEKGVRLTSTIDPQSSFVAYLVFNEASSKVEVFLPKMEDKPILEKQAQDVWGERGHGKLSVTYVDGVWKLFLGDEEQYASKSK